MEIPKNVEIINWPTSTMWFDENGILCSVAKKGVPATLEESKQSVESFRKITKGGKVCILADITNGTPPIKEVRDYVAAESARMIKAMAVIVNSALGRMASSLYFGLKPPAYPTKAFSNENDAKEWLKQYCK